jgi:ribosomal-protein-alanine N-acetyltransferase
LTVRLSNRAALALYESEGYKTIDLWKKYYRDGEDAVVMQKELVVPAPDPDGVSMRGPRAAD